MKCSLATILFAGGVLSALPMFAQPAARSCPTGINPLQILEGTWTYSADGVFPPTQSYASAGTFRASVGTDKAGSPKGLLAITQTTSLNGQSIRQETDAGSYQIFPDCSGGTLTLNLSTRPIAFDFWFDRCGKEIRVVGTTPGAVVRGSAWGRSIHEDLQYQRCMIAAEQTCNGPLCQCVFPVCRVCAACEKAISRCRSLCILEWSVWY